MNKKMLIMTITLPLTLLGTGSVFASTNAKQEITTAYSQAEQASKAANISETHTYLQKVVNCLVGSKGVGFNANAGTPCNGMGYGAIKDYNYKMADKVRRDMLKDALLNANYGMMTNRLQIAHNASDLALKDLKKAQEDL